MKKLFKLYEEPSRCGVEEMDFNTYYNVLNSVELGTFDESKLDDISIVSYGLTAVFKKRVQYLLSDSVHKLIRNLLNENETIMIVTYEPYIEKLVELMNNIEIITYKIKEQMPYLFDFMFYCYIDNSNFSSVQSIAMQIVNIVNQFINLDIPTNITNEDINYMINRFNVLNNITTQFSNSIINNIITLTYEANGIFETGITGRGKSISTRL